jgi:non-ribosomal peptide synthase protein (TIGR01720 family)
LPVDHDYTGEVRDKDIAQHTVRLDETITSRLLKEVPRVYHTEINDILLAALAATICAWSKRTKVNIGLEGHGREHIAAGLDTTRTIGWFTTLYPLLLQLPEINTEADLIKSVKEQLRQLPDKGLGYGVLKYINKEASLQGSTPWDIVFNYFGQLDNVVSENKWVSGAAESRGAGRSPEHIVEEKIAVNSSVRDGKLVLNWSYSSLHYNEATIVELAESYLASLEKIIAHCLEQLLVAGVNFTPSDYGLGAEIKYTELDRFLNESVNGRQRRNEIEGLYRLSGLQEGMLFHGLYDVRIGAYMEQFACELFGVHQQTLEKSWAYMVKRHSILRSAFYVDAFSIPVQAVFSQVELPLTVLDYRHMNEA